MCMLQLQLVQHLQMFLQLDAWQQQFGGKP